MTWRRKSVKRWRIHNAERTALRKTKTWRARQRRYFLKPNQTQTPPQKTSAGAGPIQRYQNSPSSQGRRKTAVAASHTSVIMIDKRIQPHKGDHSNRRRGAAAGCCRVRPSHLGRKNIATAIAATTKISCIASTLSFGLFPFRQMFATHRYAAYNTRRDKIIRWKKPKL